MSVMESYKFIENPCNLMSKKCLESFLKESCSVSPLVILEPWMYIQDQYILC